MKLSNTLDTIMFLSGVMMKTHISDSIYGSSHRVGWSPAWFTRPAVGRERVPEC